MAAQCSPPTYFWESFEIDYPKKCIKIQMMYQGLAWSDLALDIMVLSLPIPVVVSLQLPWRTKIKVIDILMLGTVVLGSGIARVTSFMQVVTFTNHNAAIFFKDNTYYSGGPLFWIFAESAIAIIGACLPTLAPLWSKNRSVQSKIGSSVNRPWYKPNRKVYGQLEGHHRMTRGGENASDRHLVRLGTGTSIIADAIGLEERPEEGVKVHSTISSNYAT
ncbi:MAG: hypothetical protein L6R42_000912 [Xanthoria sp. 1 TBL-2021]|nr:MAG: hypothetical protein L6R42_000912 [Xanthoria sp. 1 TBL-2021]